MPDAARTLAVLHVGQLHVDVLRRATPAHGPGRGVRQRCVRDALVLRHRLGPAGRADRRVRDVEKLFQRHYAVSDATIRTLSGRLLVQVGSSFAHVGYGENPPASSAPVESFRSLFGW